MFTYLSRSTCSAAARRTLFAGVLAAIGVLGVSTDAALAGSACQGQAFSQPFTAYGDSNYYTLDAGSDFATSPEKTGWKLSGGAELVKTTRPDGSSGSVLNLPSGAQAVSAPMCVTLEYQTARMYVRSVKGTEGVSVSVSYAGTSSASKPSYTATIGGKSTAWAPSEPFKVHPELAGSQEGAREVRFVFAAVGCGHDYQLAQLWVDPRRK